MAGLLELFTGVGPCARVGLFVWIATVLYMSRALARRSREFRAAQAIQPLSMWAEVIAAYLLSAFVAIFLWAFCDVHSWVSAIGAMRHP